MSKCIPKYAFIDGTENSGRECGCWREVDEHRGYKIHLPKEEKPRSKWTENGKEAAAEAKKTQK